MAESDRALNRSEDSDPGKAERRESAHQHMEAAEPDPEETGHKETALEETARQKLGVARWDRPHIFRETAEAATDTRLPYWSMLTLSGAIATLGLALDNAAVVIGAMLIAPLLAPTMGLALALAMGDLRLAARSGVAVIVSTAVVIFVATVLTLALPFQTFTSEITARTRPTTLDLGIAVFSGLAGAVVTVTRREGLSAAIPGVAVAVALIPPLAVTGFSAGAGFRWSFIEGSMLLYGANLAGIVLSGTVVFLLIGMHRPDVVATAFRWHAEAEPKRFADWASRTRWFPTFKPIRSPLARIGIVLAVVVTLAVPLTITLAEIGRETRIQRAVRRASEIFAIEGRSSILNLQPVIGKEESHALLRVATTEWFGDAERESFERLASEHAREPVRLVLEQLPTSSGDLDQLAGLFPTGRTAELRRSTPDLSNLLAPAWEGIEQALAGLSLPDSTQIVGSEMLFGSPERRRLTIGYVAARPFGPDATSILNGQLRQGLSAPDLDVLWLRIPPDTISIAGAAADTSTLRDIVNLAHRFERLHLAVLADTTVADEAVDSTVARMVGLGMDRKRIERRYEENQTLGIVPYIAGEHEPAPAER